MVVVRVGFSNALHVGAVVRAAVATAVAQQCPWAGGITEGTPSRMRSSWIYGPSCTALTWIGNDCRTHPPTVPARTSSSTMVQTTRTCGSPLHLHACVLASRFEIMMLFVHVYVHVLDLLLVLLPTN
jgi:hypothetical protein